MHIDNTINIPTTGACLPQSGCLVFSTCVCGHTFSQQPQQMALCENTFSLRISLLSGESRLLEGFEPGDTLETLCHRAALEFGAQADELRFSRKTDETGLVGLGATWALHPACGSLEPRWFWNHGSSTLEELDLSGELTCVIVTAEQSLDQRALRMFGGLEHNAELATEVFRGYVHDYRKRRVIPAPPAPEAALPDIWAGYHERRLSVEFAVSAACAREVGLLGPTSAGSSTLNATAGKAQSAEVCNVERCKDSSNNANNTTNNNDNNDNNNKDESNSDHDLLVVDIGSSELKAGFAGGDAPSCIVRAMTNAHNRRSNPGDEEDETVAYRYLLEQGIVIDWHGMEKIWHRLFCNELAVDPAKKCILLTEAILNPRSNRSKLFAMMFDVFDAVAVHIEAQPVLALYASGRSAGVVLDMGDGVTQVLCIWMGFVIPHSAARLQLAGRDITEQLVKCLKDQLRSCNNNSNNNTNSSSASASAQHRELEFVRELKEKQCYVALDFESELRAELRSYSYEKHHATELGEVVSLGSARFRCPEILFQPRLAGLEARGVHEMVFSSITACDLDLQQDLYCNVVLAGGTTMLSGFPERLKGELQALCPKSLRGVKIVAAPERKNSVWIGGSIVASLGNYSAVWVTKRHFAECETLRSGILGNEL
ncbi:unnamed protein product [Polarella glacialis]|uniref:Actin n=1 Tax=Polarella glacialis TaxID=89957 RepID=A0A813IXX5_POLGL|nr:unnamed protein product [Polarella glacialis]